MKKAFAFILAGLLALSLVVTFSDIGKLFGI